jgi:electron transport complex protein RnfG
MGNKKESSFKNMVATLFVVTLVAGLALGGVYNATKAPIARANKLKTETALKAVIPNFDKLETFKISPNGETDSLIINKCLKDGELVGVAIESISRNGYDPTPIRIMVGFLPDGKIFKTSVISHKETPGLGSKMGDEKFSKQFEGKNPDSFNLTVKKDGGDVDAITAATISSRAFCDAVKKAHLAFKKEGGNN